MKILVEITDSEFNYLQKLAKNGEQMGHYESLLAGGVPFDHYHSAPDGQSGEVKIINNMRRNNPLDMTINEQIEKIKEEICDHICKHPERATSGVTTQEELDDICANECPLRRL